MSDLEQAKKRMIRYRILKICDAGRPHPVGEGLIAEVLSDADLAASPNDIRRAMQYLGDKGYLDVVTPHGASHWEARLLPPGVDYLEDTRIEDAGIARPAFR